MAIVTKDFLAGVTTNFKALFFKALQEVTTDWSKIATELPSNTDTESYSWLGSIPRMRQWKGDKQVKGLNPSNFSIQNVDYEVTLGVDRNTFEDDKIGIVKPRIMDMAYEAQEYMDYLVFTALAAGATTKAYDGQYFFSASHSTGASGTQSNTATSALDATQLKANLVAIRKFKDDQGKVLNLRGDLLLVPPDLENTALELTKSDLLIVTGLASTSALTSAPAINILKGRVETLVSSYLTDTNDWFTLVTNRPLKPAIFQIRKPNTFVAQDQPYAEDVFNRKEFKYSCEARYGVGLGLWFYAYGNIVSGG